MRPARPQAAGSDGSFASQTALRPGPDGDLLATFGPELTGFGGLHGGYLAGMVLRAALTAEPDTDRAPRELRLQLLDRVRGHDLRLRPTLRRSGTSMSTVQVEADEAGAIRAIALVTFGSRRHALSHSGLTMPEVPGPEACEPIARRPAPEARAGSHVEHRPAGGPLPLSGSDHAHILVWMRLLSDEPLDAPIATMLADAGPPALYAAIEMPVPMPSTSIAINYTHVEAPASQWALADIRTTHAADGYAIEDLELWSPDASLILQSRQLRRVLTPTPPSMDDRRGDDVASAG